MIPGRTTTDRSPLPLTILADGLLVEAEGRTVVHVDVSAGSLCIRLAGRTPLAFGLSSGGLDDAVRVVSVALLRSTRARTAPAKIEAPRQANLFSAGQYEIDLARLGTDVSPGRDGVLERAERLKAVLRDAILERCRIVARRRDGRIDEMARRVHAFADTPLVYSRDVLDAPYLVDDVLRFNAAAIAVAMAEELPPPVRAASGVSALTPLLAQWRSLFAWDGRVTRAVHKTLTALDDTAFADVDPHDVWRLRHIPLVEAVRSPRHLRLLSERRQLGGQTMERDLRLLQLAHDDALDDAIDDVVNTLRLQRIPMRQREHVLCEVLSQATNGVADGQLAAAQAVRTLVRRRLEEVRRERRHRRRVAGARREAAIPPIPMPVDPRLRFLVTEDDFLAEGERMHNCVGAHFSTAVEGGGYFFHFEDDGGPATVRVSAAGRVVEAKGVCNKATTAAQRAARALSTWGAPLSLLQLGEADACIWHGAGPVLRDRQRPLRTLIALVQACSLELEADTIRDVAVYVDILSGAVERALFGRCWFFFDDEARRVRVHALEADDPIAGGP